MSTKTATASATISRSKAKGYTTDIRRTASRIAGIIETASDHPEWATAHQAVIDHNLSEALGEIDGLTALLREGLGVQG